MRHLVFNRVLWVCGSKSIFILLDASINSTWSLHSVAAASRSLIQLLTPIILLRPINMVNFLSHVFTKESSFMETSDPTPNLLYGKQLFLSFHLPDAIYVSGNITCCGVWCPLSCAVEASGTVTYYTSRSSAESDRRWQWVWSGLVRHSLRQRHKAGADSSLCTCCDDPTHNFAVTKCELVDLLENLENKSNRITRRRKLRISQVNLKQMAL